MPSSSRAASTFVAVVQYVWRVPSMSIDSGLLKRTVIRLPSSTALSGEGATRSRECSVMPSPARTPRTSWPKVRTVCALPSTDTVTSRLSE